MIDTLYIIMIGLYIPVIAIFDYLFFTKLLRNTVYYKEDGYYVKPAKWYWIIPTFLECLMFLGGVAIGILSTK